MPSLRLRALLISAVSLQPHSNAVLILDVLYDDIIQRLLGSWNPNDYTRVCLSPYRAGIILNARHRKRNLESAINLFKCKIVSVISVETVNYGYMRKYM